LSGPKLLRRTHPRVISNCASGCLLAR
jgi:hypothetical protein